MHDSSIPNFHPGREPIDRPAGCADHVATLGNDCVTGQVATPRSRSQGRLIASAATGYRGQGPVNVRIAYAPSKPGLLEAREGARVDGDGLIGGSTSWSLGLELTAHR